jgi:AAA domain
MASNHVKHVSIYIVGAQCTGKTTLTEAIHKHLISNHLVPSIGLIKEAARGVLLDHGFTRDDILSSPNRCMQLQSLILETQLVEENEMHGYPMLLSDRSGVDPLVYATMYGPGGAAGSLIDGTTWGQLKGRMREAVVVVCQPVVGWLFDDGVRLIPRDEAEWIRTHELFCSLMRTLDIEFVVLPAEIRQLASRVEFVMKCWQGCLKMEERSTN